MEPARHSKNALSESQPKRHLNRISCPAAAISAVFASVSDVGFAHSSGAIDLAIRTAAAASFNAGASVWRSVQNDARFLDGFFRPRQLAAMQLFANRPAWWERHNVQFWNDLLQEKLKHQNFYIWKEWYDCIVLGQKPFNLPDGIAQALERRIALGDGRKDFWDRDTAAVNAEIVDWVSEARQNISDSQDFTSRPATVQTVVHNGVVQLKNIAPETDISSQILKSAVQDIAKALVELAELSESKNADRNFSNFCSAAAASAAKIIDDQAELFQSGRNQKTIASYAATVNSEWDSLSAARFHSTLMQFDELLKRFPAWRSFIGNPPRAVTQPDFLKIVEEANSLVHEFRDSLELIVPDVSQRLHGLISRLSQRLDLWAADNKKAEDNSELLLADVAESISNVLRSVAQIALHSVGKPFANGMKQEVPVQAELAGQRLVKWIFVGGPLVTLAYMFPSVFTWLRPIGELFKGWFPR